MLGPTPGSAQARLTPGSYAQSSLLEVLRGPVGVLGLELGSAVCRAKVLLTTLCPVFAFPLLVTLLLGFRVFQESRLGVGDAGESGGGGGPGQGSEPLPGLRRQRGDLERPREEGAV